MKNTSFAKSFRFTLEELDQIIVPSVARVMLTFELTDTTSEPDRTWSSPSSGPNSVPTNDNLRATQAVNYRFTGDELSKVRSTGGFTLTENIRFREEDEGPDDNIKDSNVTLNFKQDNSDVVYAPDSWNTTNAEHTDWFYEGSTAEYYGWVNDPDSPANFKSRLLHMTNGAIGGGAIRDARPGTAGVGYAMLPQFANPQLPVLEAFATSYRILSWFSPDGTTNVISAKNDTGYTLLSASSPELVFNEGTEDLEIPGSTALSPVYLDDTTTAGHWPEQQTSWAISNGENVFFLTGYARSDVTEEIQTLADGESVVVNGTTLPVGESALWLSFETPSGTVSFLLVSNLTYPGNLPPVFVVPVIEVINPGYDPEIEIPISGTDPEGNDIVIVSILQPLHGTVSLAGDVFQYVPHDGFYGVDTFYYAISDGQGGVVVVSVTVIITDLEIPPDAENYNPAWGCEETLLWLNTEWGRTLALWLIDFYSIEWDGSDASLACIIEGLLEPKIPRYSPA